MSTTNIKKVKNYSIKVVGSENHGSAISASDAEMDKRATHAVKAAVAKAKVCKQPIARYDAVQKRAYIEYVSGERKYVD